MTVVAEDENNWQRAYNVVLTIGGEYGSFPCRTLNADRDPKDSATQTASEDVGKKETSEYLISTDVSAGLRACRRRAVPVRRASTRRSASRNGSDQCAGPCPAVRRCVATTATIVRWADAE